MAKVDHDDLRRARLEYERDGATVLRGVLSAEQVAAVGKAIDRLMERSPDDPDYMYGKDNSEPGQGRFFGSLFAWLWDPDIEALVRDSGLAAVAGELMDASKVRFFYDQVLVKEPGTKNRTPWHQDLPYWPVSGEQVISLWVAVDAATPENGVVTYVKGSHRWNRFFAMQPFAEGQAAGSAEMAKRGVESGLYDDAEARGERRSLIDIRENPQNYEFLTWSVEPGDILVHHPLAVHGAGGNTSSAMRRRAISLRWFGDDARWDDSRPHFLRALHGRDDFPYPSLKQGGEMDAPLFPLLWERKEHAPA